MLFLDVRFVTAGIWQRLRGFSRYRALTFQLQHRFPDASAGVLGDTQCAICMEKMKVKCRRGGGGGGQVGEDH